MTTGQTLAKTLKAAATGLYLPCSEPCVMKPASGFTSVIWRVAILSACRTRPIKARRSLTPLCMCNCTMTNTLKWQARWRISEEQGRTLLMLPGLGIMGFATQALMLATLARWLNTATLQDALLNTMERRHQDQLFKIIQDADLYLEPFKAEDLQLQPVTTTPFMHALDRLLNKQRNDSPCVRTT